MLELDEVVRQNQLACLPFAKSGRAEIELLEQHPSLIDMIQRGKNAKLDSVRLRSRLGDEDAFYANAAKARPMSRDSDQSTPLREAKQSLSRPADEQTHTRLKEKASAVDLIFEMEDDDLTITDEPTPATPFLEKSRVSSEFCETSP